MNISAIYEVKMKHLLVEDELIKVEVFSEGHPNLKKISVLVLTLLTNFFVTLSIKKILYESNYIVAFVWLNIFLSATYSNFLKLIR